LLAGLALTFATTVAMPREAQAGDAAPPAGSTSTPSASAPAPSGPAATAAAASPAAPAAQPAAAAATAARRGVVVVLLGPSHVAGADAARAFARFAYRTPSIRPGKLGEAEVRVLAGEDPPADASASVAELAASRAALPSSPDDPAAGPALEALADKLGVRALVLFVPGAAGATVRVVHTDVAGAPRFDPASVSAKPTTTAQGDDYALVATSVERVVGPEPATAEPAPTEPAKTAGPTALPGKAAGTANGPLRANAKGSSPHAPPEAPADDEAFWENPWFWVAAGTVAAIGVTIIVVSQTTDTTTGTISIGGKVLQ
jgi:hypothetical protein